MAIKKLTERYSDIKDTRLATSSMIRMFNILQDEDDTYFMNIFKTFDFSSTILDNPVNTNEIGIVEPWWESISYSYYGDVNTWWILCNTNNVLNPFEEIIVGGTLDVLTKNFIPYIQRDMENIFSY
jgi:hypothetical protein